MSTLFYIDLDIAWDCAHEGGAEHNHSVYVIPWCKKHNVTPILLKEEGPAGGNPLYRFTGTKGAIASLVRDYDGDNGDFDFLMKGVHPLSSL